MPSGESAIVKSIGRTALPFQSGVIDQQSESLPQLAQYDFFPNHPYPIIDPAHFCWRKFRKFSHSRPGGMGLIGRFLMIGIRWVGVAGSAPLVLPISGPYPGRVVRPQARRNRR